MDEAWRYDLECPLKDAVWETGFESYDDAYDAMTEAMTDMVDEIAAEHPDMTDEEIEKMIDWEVRPE